MRLAALQGVYFLVTGLWPLVDIRSFQAVTGPKRDLWLVRTVGVLVAVIGAALAADARRRSRGTTTLAVGSAAGLAAIDTIYATRGTISRVYLLDAVAELALIIGWLRARRHSR
jgi:hypothetical protein